MTSLKRVLEDQIVGMTLPLTYKIKIKTLRKKSKKNISSILHFTRIVKQKCEIIFITMAQGQFITMFYYCTFNTIYQILYDIRKMKTFSIIKREINKK